jgi:hypothetical protein
MMGDLVQAGTLPVTLRLFPPKWTTLRPIGNSWAARLTILIPIVGYLIIFSSTAASYLHLIREVGGASTELTIPARMFLIYFGLCFVAAASALYSYFCPPLIKRFDSSSAFISTEGVHLGSFSVGIMSGELMKTPYAGDVDHHGQSTIGRADQSYSVQDAKIDYRLGVLEMYFRYKDDTLPVARAIIAVLYGIGFLILAVPATRVFLKVAALLWHLVISSGISWLFS